MLGAHSALAVRTRADAANTAMDRNHLVERVRAAGLAWLAMAGTLAAQQQPLFDRISVEDGLPGRQVLALVQDQQGLVWLGTDNGLARHEGVRIRSWHHDRHDPQSLPNEQVNALAEDGTGALWVATANGVGRLDAARSTFRRYALPASDAERTRANRVDDLLCDVGGRVWASTEGGLFALAPATGEAARLLPTADTRGPPGTRVLKHALVRDTLREGIWLGTDAGLVFHHLPSGAWYHAGHDPEGWGCFTPAPAGTPLPLRDGGLLWFDQEALALVHADLRGGRRVVEQLGGERIGFTPRFLVQDPDGTIWLSTWTYRLYRLSADLRSAQRIDDTPGLPGAMVEGGPYCTLLDCAGVRWFGTAQGVALLAPWRQGLQVMKPLPGRTLFGVLAQHGDSLLIGTLDHGLLLLHLPSGEARALAATGERDEAGRTWSQRTTCALSLDGGRYLVGSGHGLLWLDLARGTLVPAEQRMALPPRLATASITRLARDDRGRIWVATWAHGVYRLDPDGSVAHHHQQAGEATLQLPMNGVVDLLVTRNGDVWLGLNDGGGLLQLPAGEGPARSLTPADGPAAIYAVVTALAQGNKGTVWAGTHQGGLDHVDPRNGTVVHWTRREGLPSDRIGGVLVDRTGGVWAITSAGVAQLPAGADRFVPVDAPRGISPLRFLSRALLLHDGRLAVANEDQLLLLRTDDSDGRAPVPGVALVEARQGQGRVQLPDAGGDLRLPYDRRSLVVEAASTGHAALGAIRFRYHIAGLTDGPQDMSPSGRLDLIDLPAGLHRIHITASTDGLRWSSQPAALLLEVLPPLWATWWFRALVLLVVAGMLVLAVRHYVQQRLTAQRIAFEREQALLAERMRIASDMHDDLGAGLSGLKLRTELAARVEQDPDKQRQLAQVAGMAGELIGNMRRLIWTMDGGQGSMDDLAAYCANYARQYLSEHGIGCTVHQPTDQPAVEVSSELRRNVFLVLKEALHNVVKHARATHVEVTFQWDRQQLQLEIADDGRGSNGALTGHAQGVGLRSMRQRLEGMGGQFALTGGPEGSGTRISGRVPLGPQ